MQNATIIDPAPESTAKGQFRELLEEFCTNSHRGQSRDDLFLGKPWQDPDTGRHYFRLKDFMGHLERANFKQWGRNVVGRRLEEMGGHEFFNIRGKGANVYWVPDEFEETPQGELPATREDPI